MKLVFFYSSILVFASSLVAEEKKIEDCTKILDNNDRLSCFDSFFLTDKKQILVNQEDIKIFEEKIDDEIKDREKLIVKAPSSVIKENLILNGIKLAGTDLIFELNDKSIWRTIENVRKKDIPTPGDKVELEPGIFGSMFLKIKGTKTKIRIKKVRK
jgi:hypothetical protein|tara:strand:+ start:26 stop:496 length:471 start_codon:yes stop_codon:yes gene_type:complete